MSAESSAAVTPASRKMGRRPGAGSSRNDVLRSAKRLFANEGYDATTIRAIAADAGVDSALVVRFFGSKERLFEAVLEGLRAQIPLMMTTATAGAGSPAPGERGRRWVEAYFRLWEASETRQAAQALVRGAIGSPGATQIMQDALNAQFEGEPELAAVSAMLLGVAVARYIVAAGPLSEMSIDELVDMFAPSIQIQLDRA